MKTDFLRSHFATKSAEDFVNSRLGTQDRVDLFTSLDVAMKRARVALYLIGYEYGPLDLTRQSTPNTAEASAIGHRITEYLETDDGIALVERMLANINRNLAVAHQNAQPTSSQYPKHFPLAPR